MDFRPGTSSKSPAPFSIHSPVSSGGLFAQGRGQSAPSQGTAASPYPFVAGSASVQSPASLRVGSPSLRGGFGSPLSESAKISARSSHSIGDSKLSASASASASASGRSAPYNAQSVNWIENVMVSSEKQLGNIDRLCEAIDDATSDVRDMFSMNDALESCGYQLTWDLPRLNTAHVLSNLKMISVQDDNSICVTNLHVSEGSPVKHSNNFMQISINIDDEIYDVLPFPIIQLLVNADERYAAAVGSSDLVVFSLDRLMSHTSVRLEKRTNIEVVGVLLKNESEIGPVNVLQVEWHPFAPGILFALFEENKFWIFDCAEGNITKLNLQADAEPVFSKMGSSDTKAFCIPRTPSDITFVSIFFITNNWVIFWLYPIMNHLSKRYWENDGKNVVETVSKISKPSLDWIECIRESIENMKFGDNYNSSPLNNSYFRMSIPPDSADDEEMPSFLHVCTSIDNQVIFLVGGNLSTLYEINMSPHAGLWLGQPDQSPKVSSLHRSTEKSVFRCVPVNSAESMLCVYNSEEIFVVDLKKEKRLFRTFVGSEELLGLQFINHHMFGAGWLCISPISHFEFLLSEERDFMSFVNGESLESTLTSIEALPPFKLPLPSGNIDEVVRYCRTLEARMQVLKKVSSTLKKRDQEHKLLFDSLTKERSALEMEYSAMLSEVQVVQTKLKSIRSIFGECERILDDIKGIKTTENEGKIHKNDIAALRKLWVNLESMSKSIEKTQKRLGSTAPRATDAATHGNEFQ